MRTLISHRRAFRLLHRCVSYAAIGAYLCAASGAPMLLPTAGQMAAGDAWDGIPFPCQYSRCGCTTAEQCYRACCCHKPAERLAWAKLRGVTLKAEWLREMLANVKQTAAQTNLAQSEPHSSSPLGPSASAEAGCCCCEAETAPSCCAPEPAAPSCCSQDEPQADWADETERPASDSAWPDIITPSCSGMMLQWSTVGAVLPVRNLTLPARLDGLPQTIAILSDTATILAWPPDLPPPRA